jgi:hypothetical protein
MIGITLTAKASAAEIKRRASAISDFLRALDSVPGFVARDPISIAPFYVSIS